MKIEWGVRPGHPAREVKRSPEQFAGEERGALDNVCS